MKVTRKIIILIAILMLCFTIKAYAETTEIKLTPSTTEAKAGEEITVILSGKRTNGIEGIDGILQYNQSKLKLISTTILAKEEEEEKFSDLSGKNEETGEYQLTMLLKSSPAPTEGDLMQIKFEVLKGAKEKDILGVKLTNVKLADGEGNTEDIEDIKINTMKKNNIYVVIAILAIIVIGIIVRVKKENKRLRKK